MVISSLPVQNLTKIFAFEIDKIRTRNYYVFVNRGKCHNAKSKRIKEWPCKAVITFVINLCILSPVLFGLSSDL